MDCGEVKWSGSQKPTEGVALFSSRFPTVGEPIVEVEFKLLTPGKKHLVEFYVTMIQTSGTYKFRVFNYPLGNWQDESFKTKNVFTEIVNPIAGYSGSYGVAIKQRNPKSELMSWYFHKVVITPVG